MSATSWACPACTFVNSGFMPRCEMCNGAPPPPPAAHAAPATAAPWDRYGIRQVEYDHVMAIFLTFDADGSGELSARELTTLARYLNYPHSPGDMQRMFAEMDTDRSGSLSLDEFCTWMQRNKIDPVERYGLSEQEYEEVLFQFHKHDRDTDGLLNVSEFAGLCRDQGWTRTLEEATPMFRAVDTDRSGGVSLDEMLTYRASRPAATALPDVASTRAAVSASFEHCESGWKV